VLLENLDSITNKFLSRYDSFNKFFRPSHVDRKIENNQATPEEIIETHFDELRQSLKQEILETISNNSPIFFEKLVIDVLVKLGYGGSEKDARTTLQTNDEGIDGIINEDRLGLDVIYMQAKRWDHESIVGRPEIQKFAGALQGKRARKGIFITVSRFSNTAREYAENIDSKIILIDGDQLAELMIDNNIGVEIKTTYSVKEVDTDYFIEV